MVDVIHSCVWVSDIEETTDFYEDVLGLEYSKHFVIDGVHNYFVKGGTDAEFQFKYHHDPEESVEVEPSGIDHLAVSVEDLDARVEACVDAGSDVVQEPTSPDPVDARIAFVTDPDGYVVELVEPGD